MEDRCQGGRFGRSWRSNERVSISLHSTGMDKRPIALGGGFAAVYGDNSFFDALEARVLSLPLERTRASKILKIVPTYLIYNFSHISGALIVLCKILGIALTQSACEYRRVNPGFSRGNEHMRSPWQSAGRYESGTRRMERHRKHNSREKQPMDKCSHGNRPHPCSTDTT